MERKNTISPKNLAWAVYVTALYGLWALWELLGKDMVNGVVENRVLAQLINSGLVKNLVWTLPALLLIRRFDKALYLNRRTMFAVRGERPRYLMIFLAFTIYLLAGAVIRKGSISVSDGFGWNEVVIVLFVGITEETVFRGWLLNATLTERRKWLPVLVNAAMFLLIHFPRWIHEGELAGTLQSLDFLSVPILSVIFSWAFIRGRSLWLPVALHMYWDALVFMLY